MRKIAEKRLQTRKQLWPEITSNDLWLRKERVGFTTIPRSITLIGRIMDKLSGKGFPLYSTYLTLWCHVFDEGFIEIRSDNQMAFESGFEGNRGASTWRSRMKRLEDLKFIQRKPGIASEYQYTLLINPLHVIQNHYKDKAPDQLYESLLLRLNEIGAEDLTDKI